MFGMIHGRKGGTTLGHTKVAVSVPDELFVQLEESARAEGTTRSAIVVQALQSHFDRVTAADFIERMNAAYGPPMTEEELREEAALARARASALRRINEILRQGETEDWER